MKKLISILIAIGTVFATNVYAQTMNKGMDMGGMKMDIPVQPSSADALTDGEVKAVNKTNQSITLKHGPIKSSSVQMSPMTMTFAVRDAAMIANVKTGDKVKFTIENVRGIPTVTVLSSNR
jgi:Cu(I)/Ag(I) efflux system protein CusF